MPNPYSGIRPKHKFCSSMGLIFYLCKHYKNGFQEIYCALLEVKLKSSVDVKVQEMGYADFIKNEGKCLKCHIDKH